MANLLWLMSLAPNTDLLNSLEPHMSLWLAPYLPSASLPLLKNGTLVISSKSNGLSWTRQNDFLATWSLRIYVGRTPAIRQSDVRRSLRTMRDHELEGESCRFPSLLAVCLLPTNEADV